MLYKILSILTIFSLLLVFAGCHGVGNSNIGRKETNLLGIVKVESDSYASSGPATMSISSDEFLNRKNYSGGKTTLLWGLITLKDY